MTFGFQCTCGMDLEVDLVVDSAGSPGHYGPPGSPAMPLDIEVEYGNACRAFLAAWRKALAPA